MKCFSYILMILLCGKVSAQQIYFSEAYQVFNTTNALGSAVQKSDSGYVFVTHHSGLVYAYTFISTDKFGDTLFTKSYVFDQTYVSVGPLTHGLIETRDGNYVGCGNRMDTSNNRNGYVVKFSPNGDTLWTRIVGGAAFDAFNTLYEDSNGLLWLCGQTSSSGNGQGDVWLVRMDSNGNVLSDNTYGTAQNEVGLCAELTQDGGIIMSGFSSPCPYVIKLDSLRNVEWQYTYCNYNGYAFVSQLNDSEYVVACCDVLSVTETQACLFKLDSNGIEVWSRHFGFALNEDVLYAKPIILADGIVVTGSTQPPSDYPGAFLAKTDLNGYMQWQRRYTINPNSYQETFNVIPTSDNGFLMSGYCIFANQDAWLLKVDSLGCDSANCDGVGVFEYDPHKQLLVFPNPSSGQVTIAASSATENSFVEIFDATGSLVDRLDFQSTTSVLLDCSSYSEGIYLLRMISEDDCVATERRIISR